MLARQLGLSISQGTTEVHDDVECTELHLPRCKIAKGQSTSEYAAGKEWYDFPKELRACGRILS